MDLRKINTILNLYLELTEEDQKALLNLLTPTPLPKENDTSKTKDFLEEIKKAAEKARQPLPPFGVPSIYPHTYPPYVKKGDPFYPTIIY